ncbi:hypothetical protein F2Q69_00007091 [Brassica cretica]|uniref:Uncharacterized protein n=1 Tax=Brassica cretica TaxID=69181 RepID=A0A8S9PFC7_BRACR|nr:hypothetical protein F2Q69_00007091 [Brassica cretica]
MLIDAHVWHKACVNSIPFTLHGIANCPGSLFFFNVTLFVICSLASENILLMSSSVSLVSQKNIYNLCSSIDGHWWLSIDGGLLMSIDDGVRMSIDFYVDRTGWMWVFCCELLVSHDPHGIARCG